MNPRNLLTTEKFKTNVSRDMDPKIIDTVTNTILRAMSEGNPFYFYINEHTIEAKINPFGVLCVSRVSGGHTIKFKIQRIGRLSAEHCAKRVIEVLA